MNASEYQWKELNTPQIVTMRRKDAIGLRIKIADQVATITRLTNLIESLDTMIEEAMGEWYNIQYGQCPIFYSTLAQMRDAIEEAK